MKIDEITTAHLKEIFNRCQTNSYFNDAEILLTSDGKLRAYSFHVDDDDLEFFIEDLNQIYNKFEAESKEDRLKLFKKLKQEFEPNSEAMNISKNSQFGAYVPDYSKIQFDTDFRCKKPR